MAKLYQLANDPATYGKDAGKWLIVSDNLENELSKPMDERHARDKIEGARVVVRPCRTVYFREYGDVPGTHKCHVETCDAEPHRAEFWGAYWDCHGLQAWMADFPTHGEAEIFAAQFDA